MQAAIIWIGKMHIVGQYEFLLNSRFDCGFVQLFDKEAYDPEYKKYPNIMHISDVHMDMILHSKKRDLIQQMTDSRKNYGRIDLLAISGDLVEANTSNAGQIQENYDYLAELLREIAALLWDRGDGRVSFDWKRRFLMVPGNHDFAAMNLLKTVFQHRAAAASVLISGRNKIMAIFAYYGDVSSSFN